MNFWKDSMPERYNGFGPLLVAASIAVAGLLFFIFLRDPADPTRDFGTMFDGQRSLNDVSVQVSFGPRPPGSEAHAQMIDWMVATLTAIGGWELEVQRAEYNGTEVSNVIAKRGQGPPWIVLGAHYDTRFIADQDPDQAKRLQPVLGANDGASGVAVLMELGRVLPRDLDKEIWLVFFDAEDNGRVPGWEWIMGSRAFVQGLEVYPDAAVIVDMVGDADLNVYQEVSSDAQLTEEIWGIAGQLGYSDILIPEHKYTIIDDHTPFLEAGIPAVDIIDFDYPFWHTSEDTLDKISSESLQIVGNTLLAWLETK